MRVSDWDEVAALEGELQDYRVRTIALLRKYLRYSVECGRLPSLLGREFFRTNVTSYTARTFEDAVIFVLDIERLVERLGLEQKAIIASVVFQEYSYDEAADILCLPRRSFVRRFAYALDSLSQLLLDAGMLDRARQPLSATTVKLLSRPENPDGKKPAQGVRGLVGARTASSQKFCQVSKIAKFPVIA